MELILTVAHRDLDLNQGSHGYKPRALTTELSRYPLTNLTNLTLYQKPTTKRVRSSEESQHDQQSGPELSHLQWSCGWFELRHFLYWAVGEGIR